MSAFAAAIPGHSSGFYYRTALHITYGIPSHHHYHIHVGLSKSESLCPVSDATLLSVANYTLNDEAGRVERLEGVETKFYSLQKYDVIASAFVFATEVVRGKTEVFSFILVLPYSEMSDYLARHSLCETRVQRLLKNYFINPLKEMVRDASSFN